MRETAPARLLAWTLAGASAVPLVAIGLRVGPAPGGFDAGAFGNSLAFAGLGALVATLLGSAAALVAGLLEFPFRRPLTAAVVVPLAAPPAFWWIGGSRLPLHSPEQGLLPAALVAGWALSPVPFLLTLAATREIPRAAWDAARVSLAPLARLVAVLVPMVRSGVTAGFLLVAVLLLGESELPFLFGFRTTTTAIVTEFARTFEVSAVAARAAPLLVTILALGLALKRPLLTALLSAPKGGVGPSRRKLAASSLALLALAAPSLLALAGYVGPVGAAEVRARVESLRGSVILSSVAEPVGGAWLALLLGGGAAYVLRRSRGLAAFLTAGLLLFCVPAAIWSIGWIELGQSLGGASAPPALAHVARLWGLAAIGLAAARSRLPASLEQAADLVPVSPLARSLRLVLPPLAPSLAAASVLIAALVFSDRDVASLLLPAGSERLMLDLYLLSANAPAAAVGTLAVAVLVAGLAVAVLAALGPWLLLRRHV